MDSIERLNQLLAAVGDRRRAVICTHNNPDPDAIASALALKVMFAKTKGIRSRILYGGVIGRASNRAMVAQCRIDMRRVRTLPSLRQTVLCLVDAQPGGRNTIIPRGTPIDVVIDHHRSTAVSRGESVAYRDLRMEIGATSTIASDYLFASGVPIEKRLATALFYGIRTDIGDLGRHKADHDLEVLARLFPLASQKLLARIESPRLKRDYFEMLLRGMDRAVTYRDAVTTRMGTRCNPDIIAELADLLLRMEGMRWSIACGIHEGGVQFSLRSTARGSRAGLLAIRLAGKGGSAGGHNRSAGGRIEPAPGQSAEDAEADLVRRFLAVVKRPDAPPQAIRPEQAERIAPRPSADCP